MAVSAGQLTLRQLERHRYEGLLRRRTMLLVRNTVRRTSATRATDPFLRPPPTFYLSQALLLAIPGCLQPLFPALAPSLADPVATRPTPRLTSHRTSQAASTHTCSNTADNSSAATTCCSPCTIDQFPRIA